MRTIWDNDMLVKAMKAAGVTSSLDFAVALQSKAMNVDIESGELPTWPTRWATETLRISKQQLSAVTIAGRRAQGATAACQISGPRGQGFVWDVKLSHGYAEQGALATKEQLTKAGARLASVLRAAWP